ncbi:MAG: flagellar hook-basal body complex protein FliE [Lachnospiraceae bacterium]|nr:flagellar hook-basal body complex protein FliE [Lachnospiraceae bacterium]
MDKIQKVYGIDTDAVRNLKQIGNSNQNGENKDMFKTLLDSAINNINTTNAYLSNAENEKIKFALGESESTHDLTIALQKASTALQYTVAVRDKFLEAYKEIMNMQI